MEYCLCVPQDAQYLSNEGFPFAIRHRQGKVKPLLLLVKRLILLYCFLRSSVRPLDCYFTARQCHGSGEVRITQRSFLFLTFFCGLFDIELFCASKKKKQQTVEHWEGKNELRSSAQFLYQHRRVGCIKLDDGKVLAASDCACRCQGECFSF